MIAMISVRQTADKPNFPLRPLAVFTGSSMTLGVVDVPPTREGIAVTGVSLAVENAVGAVVSASAVESGGVWTATIPASHFGAVGVVAMGVTISASGTDENGAARSWIVGKGDLSILPADGVPVPGETLQNVHLRDAVPATPLRGDLCKGANGWQIYTGEAWAAIAPSPSTSAPLMDGTASAGSSAAYARGDHRHPTDTTRASKADATLTPTYGEWACNPAYVQNYGNITLKRDASNGSWYPYGDEYFGGAGAQMGVPKGDASSTSLTWAYPADGPVNITASRSVIGYVLGSQTAKPIASEAEAEALRRDKTSRSELCAAWAANTVYTTTSFVIHDNAIYRCTTAHTSGSTWDSTKWTAATIADVLALYLPKSGGTVDILTVKFPITVGSAGNERTYGVNSISQGSDHIDFPSTTGTLALTADLPYDLGTQITIDSNSVQTDTTDPNNPITYAEVTLANRTANIVEIVVAIDELRVTLPAATNGKVRDFGLGIAVGDGTAALAAPALVVYGEGTESVLLMNPDGAMPELADGTATMVGATLLYFSEFGPTAFLVKGEQVQPITQ